MGSSAAKPSRERVAAHRERLRARGLRQVQFWVPDTRTEAFAKTAHEQSLAVSLGSGEADDQEFVDAISWDWVDDAPEPA